MDENSIFAREDFEKVIGKYDLGSIVKEPVLEKGGLVNYNFCVDTTDGKYMFRATDGLSDQELGKRYLEHAVTEHLSNSDFPYESPFFLTNDDGEKITRIGEKTFEVYKRVEGEAGSPIEKENAEEAIKMIAEYHKAMNGFSVDSSSSRVPSEYDESGWLKSEWDKIGKKVQNPENETDQLIKDNMDKIMGAYELVKETATPNNPNVFVHGDFHPGNMIYRDNKLVGLIDFGNVKYGTKEQDLHRTSDCELEDLSQRVGEYRKFNDLSSNEESNILPESIMQRLSTIRWAYLSMKKSPEKRDAMLKGMMGGLDRAVSNYEQKLSVAA